MAQDNTPTGTVQSIFEGLLSSERKGSPRETQAEPEVVDTDETELESGEDTSAEAEPSEQSEDEPAEIDEVAEDEPNDEPAQPPKHRVKINGEDQEVTLDELLKGYSRTADYTRKTQEAAEVRKRAEAEETAAKADRAKIALQLGQLSAALEAMEPAEPDWDSLRQGDPAEYAAQWTEWSRFQQRRAAVEGERQKAEQQLRKDQETDFQRFVVDEQRKLAEAIPEWKKPEVAKAEKAELVEFAKSLGYTDDDLRNTYDHRAIKVLRMAMLQQKSQKKAPALKQRLDTIKSATPGAGVQKKPVTALTRAKQRLAKTGRSDDSVPIFLAAIQSER
jgi:hypothetical protein